MVENINTLVQVINSLRAKQLHSYAAELDRFLHKYAQEMGGNLPVDLDSPTGLEEMVGADDMETQQESPMEQPSAEMPQMPGQETTGLSDEENKYLQTLYHQFEKWHSVLDRELPKFDYLGTENIDAIRSALSNVHKAFQAAMANTDADYNADVIERWNAEINNLIDRMHKSQAAKLDRTKAIIDTGMLYDTTKRLFESVRRIGEDDPNMAGVIQEFTSLMRVFANVIKSTAEQIAKTDLTEVR